MKKITEKQRQMRITKIEKLIFKYLQQVDLEHIASDNGNERQEQKAIDQQFELFAQIEEYPKSAIKEACKASQITRINEFFKMYM